MRGQYACVACSHDTCFCVVIYSQQVWSYALLKLDRNMSGERCVCTNVCMVHVHVYRRVFVCMCIVCVYLCMCLWGRGEYIYVCATVVWQVYDWVQ